MLNLTRKQRKTIIFYHFSYIMTICKVCGRDMLDIKDYWYFYEWKRLWLKCKSCMLEWRKTEYERSMARKRDRDRYYNNLKRREYVFKTALERRKEKWYWHIHTKTEKMIKKLWMRPNYCPICWKENRIIAHHPDYSKWYEIVFCCQPCHAKIHKWELEVFNIIDLLKF